MTHHFAYQGCELATFAKARNWKHYLAEQLRPFIRGRVLEVGAGLGSMTRVLRGGGERSWTCVEPDSQMADQLRRAAEGGECGDPTTLDIVTGSLADAPPSAAFDTILYVDVLEHIEDDRRELELAAKLLAPEGNLIVLSPAHSVLYSPFDHAVGHFRRYSRRSLRRAGPVGLPLVRLRYLDCIGLFASLANRLLLRSPSPTESLIRVWDTLMVPLSRLVDPLLLFGLGKSVLAVWRDSRKLDGAE
jgi:2-polyprenyl-3-methyl-5-hydroxy-6-metoxy-1,4-benzoquinol methylase